VQLIPGDLYEAASIDGATGIRKLFAITLPLVTRTLLVALIFRTLDALRVLDIFYIMVGGQGNMATVAVYHQQQLSQFLEDTPRNPGHDLPVPDRGRPQSRRERLACGVKLFRLGKPIGTRVTFRWPLECEKCQSGEIVIDSMASRSKTPLIFFRN
jgi:hypothetical protein